MVINANDVPVYRGLTALELDNIIVSIDIEGLEDMYETKEERQALLVKLSYLVKDMLSEQLDSIRIGKPNVS